MSTPVNQVKATLEPNDHSYRNRFVRTTDFEAEQDPGGPLWPGLMKNSSSPTNRR